ncbi:hypothetical protein GP486_002024 [Trichoglossum hirsutum]|uniref:AAA+ ATPase domain-containing protein n=1 Tax=Trichoglossum hirsutum TaxID=265104 RepID=A0A9P8LFV1_9PEZI|nr:hypothetical protein GP486_002024 [Trichoglossum hirsutum]
MDGGAGPAVKSNVGDQLDASKNLLSNEEVAKQVEGISRFLDFMGEEWKNRMNNLVNRLSSTDMKVEFRELEHSLGIEVQKLQRVRESLAVRIGGESQDEPETNIFRRCTSELKFVSWKTAAGLPSPPTVHCAIAVPINQPTQEDLIPSTTQSEAAPYRETLEYPQDHSLGRKELPERILINSVRLTGFLDFNLHDGTLSWDNFGPLCILRPFKLLVYHNNQIRQQLRDLEHMRLDLKPATEEEYDEEWRLNPPEDTNQKKQIFNRMTLPELTGFIKDLRSLAGFMDTYIQPALTRARLDAIFFSDLWYTFPAGSLVYVKDKKVPQKIWKVIQRTGGRRYVSRPDSDTLNNRDDWYLKYSQFVIDCFHLDFDGVRYVPTYYQARIDHFGGSQSVISLPILPLEVAEDAGLVDRRAIVERAREFVACTKPSHREYTGRNQLLKPNGAKLVDDEEDIPDKASKYSEWIESEVMVDFERAFQELPTWRPGTSELNLYAADINERGDGTGIDRDNVWDTKMSNQIMSREMDKWNKWDKERPPAEEEDLLLLPDRVFAFVFRTRKWACLQLGKGPNGAEKLRKRNPRKEPWNDLQLPDGHKRLVQSLIESHSADNTTKGLQFDLVRAKGKGVIILLHGVPGVGKTSTAECAAEANNKPLLPITCGDLGSTPRDVETKLVEAFQLAQLWNCVLLLDEADIFLANRCESDIQRNALVSVFLRVLEYYEGILFLTTNRVGVFDEAFKSRIHMALYYPPLEWKYTRKIWDSHLKKLKSSGLVEVEYEDILEYAEDFFDKQNAKGSPIGPVWNGRQIRNAFQSAVALAGYRSKGGEKIRLEREHFQRVSNVSNEFNNYIWNIKCQSDAEKAVNWGYRYDQYRPSLDLNLRPVRSQSIDVNAVNFGRNSQRNSLAPLSQPPPINDAMLPFNIPQQPIANPMAQTQGFFSNGTQGTAQPQAMQGQFSQQQLIQQQQQQQQLNFLPLVNTQVDHSSQANVQLQAQYSLNSSQHNPLHQQVLPGGTASAMTQNIAGIPMDQRKMPQMAQQ